MKKVALGKAVTALLILVLLSSSGCLIDPKEKPVTSKLPPSSEDEYGDLTEREHTVKNLVLSYANGHIEKYEELLCADFLWFLQDGDYEPGEDNFYERQADIDMTRNMFLAAKGQCDPPIDRLYLHIDAGDWYAIDEIGSEACDDCWETQRHYHIEMAVGKDTYIGDDTVIICIRRDPVTGRYCIARMYDIKL